jgi:hypothetical protein
MTPSTQRRKGRGDKRRENQEKTVSLSSIFSALALRSLRLRVEAVIWGVR